ncbi:MAG: MmgE/PrpD family protein [Oscillibacter sp.]|nr:MmgE/PrpD family protein [Oscillibacter sp.]
MGTQNQAAISQRIAKFALSSRLSEIPDAVAEYGKLLLLDTFGVAMSCQDMDHVKAIRGALAEMGSVPRCTLWGTEEKVRLADAVLYNSALIHGADYDDTHVGGIVHPSAAVVGTALTVGEQCGATGRQMLEAIVAGWEIIIRLALAAKGRFHDVGFHGTGIVAPFAAACTAARLLGDSEETLVNALGICGSQAAALQEFLRDGSWVKKIHPGWAAHSAVYALGLARNGFTGPREVFEGEFGLWNTHCGGTDGLEEFFAGADLGEVWRTTEITVKLYPVCHMTHSFIDCMLSLQREEGFTAEEIDSAECRIESRCYPIVCTPREAKIRPNTDYIMRFSLPYVVAMAAKKGRVSPWEIDLSYARDPGIQSLMDRIQCVDDDSKRNPGYFPGFLTVTLKDGRRFVRDQRYEMGTPQNPLDPAAVRRKFMDNLAPLYSAGQIQHLAELIGRFETLSGAGELTAALRR